MPLVTIGLDHKNTPLEILGKVIIPSASLRDKLRSLTALPAVKGAVILSTCNRCEIYAEIHSLEQNIELTNWFYTHAKVPMNIMEQYCVTRYEEEVVIHLMRVASSIDSMIVGEPQILGQVKAAYQVAAELNCSSIFLTRLFEKTFATAKQIRTQTELGKYPVSYASAVLELAQKLFSKLSTKHALFIGTGDMITLTINHFHSHKVSSITVTGRSKEKAQALAQQFNGKAIALTEIPEHLHHYDIVVSCTASDTLILDKLSVEKAMKKRKHRPLCIADIALPCDVEPSVETLEDVYLYPMEKLAYIIDENQTARLQAANRAEAMVVDKAHEYFNWTNSRKVSDIIKSMRDNAEFLRQETLQKALTMLKNGKSAEETLAYLSEALTNRLMHIPTQTLKSASEAGHIELLSLIKQLLEQDKTKP